MVQRPGVSSQFVAVRTAIGNELRTQLADILREPLPDGMVELLRQLDEQTQSRRDTDTV